MSENLTPDERTSRIDFGWVMLLYCTGLITGYLIGATA